jgi:hypothetical protein
VHARFDGPEGYAERVRKLVVRKARGAQPIELGERGGEAKHCAFEADAGFGDFERALRGHGRGAERFGCDHGVGRATVTLSRADAIEAGVARHAIEPRAKAADGVSTPARAKHGHECFVEDVLGLDSIAKVRANEREQRTSVPLVQAIECAHVAVSERI